MLGMHTALQAFKCSFDVDCDRYLDSPIWTSYISNKTKTCEQIIDESTEALIKVGCIYNGLEYTNRAHFCHFTFYHYWYFTKINNPPLPNERFMNTALSRVRILT